MFSMAPQNKATSVMGIAFFMIQSFLEHIFQLHFDVKSAFEKLVNTKYT